MVGTSVLLKLPNGYVARLMVKRGRCAGRQIGYLLVSERVSPIGFVEAAPQR
jgi:hypothetical protein